MKSPQEYTGNVVLANDVRTAVDVLNALLSRAAMQELRVHARIEMVGAVPSVQVNLLMPLE